MTRERQPNIILITCDQLAPFELGCYGGDQVATPHIDQLARRGALWETAISNYPVCMPARSIMISGQHNRTATGGTTNIAYESRAGDFNMPEYPYEGRPHLRSPTVAEELRNLGYETQAIGKWHIHSWPQDVGFDHYTIPRVHHAHSAQIYTRDGGPEFSPPGYGVDFEIEEASRFLGQSRDRPFFLYYNISPPHCPIADIPEDFRTMYDPAQIKLRDNVNEEAIKDKAYWYRVYRWDFRYYAHHLPHAMELPDGYDLRSLTAEYFGAITWVDHILGRIMTAISDAGLEEDTVIVFTADHGENLGSHGYVQKGTENDESIRIPLVITGPGIPEGERIRDGVGSLVDLAPSFIELAGGAVPTHFQGSSLLGDLGGISSGRTCFFETSSATGLRSPRHTYVLGRCACRTLSDSPICAFDNVQDPFQFNNLSENVVLDQLDAQLRQFDADTPWMQQ